MSRIDSNIWRVVREGFAAMDVADAMELAAQFARVYAWSASGTGDIGERFSLGRAFRPVYVRCHFVGGNGAADLLLGVDHRDGPSFDARLASVANVGTGSDVNLAFGGVDPSVPSPCPLQRGDALRIDWSNPDPGNMTWGLEVGLSFVGQVRLPVAETG